MSVLYYIRISNDQKLIESKVENNFQLNVKNEKIVELYNQLEEKEQELKLKDELINGLENHLDSTQHKILSLEEEFVEKDKRINQLLNDLQIINEENNEFFEKVSKIQLYFN